LPLIEVDEINSLIYQQFPGERQVYSSADSIQGTEDDVQYPVEYLNSINMGGFPPSQLQIKRGVPLMLLWNLDPGLGLCNGTRLQLLHMTNRVLHVKIITGPYAGEQCYIPVTPNWTTESRLQDLALWPFSL
jgi:DNA helicase Pif1, 2B domain